MLDDKTRIKTRVAVYLIGMKDDHVLLGKRKNASHMNGHWSLVAGHVAEGESASDAMIREAHEECNITLAPYELTLIGAMHHLSPPFDYINFIFKADLSNHNPTNREHHKCEALDFHHINQLPQPMAPYIKDIIHNCTSNESKWIIEYGWKQNF